MRYSTAVAALLAGTASAYPGMGGARRAMMEDAIKQAELEKRAPSPAEKRDPSVVSSLLSAVAPVSTLISTVTNDIKGISGSIATGVLNPSDKRPEAGYTFQAPGPNDSRGPCPGLNLLANYGYLPRNGLVTYDEVVQATAQGFNMATDLSTVLAVFAILADGDIATESWYIGTDPTTNVGGLNRHSTVEADISPNREDFYTGCGDNHHLSSRLFKRNVAFAAADPSKGFSMTTMGEQYGALAAESKKYNPYLYAFPFPQIVSLGAFVFYPQFFSNGTYGAGGVPNYESISSIIGAQYNSSTGNFMYVPEKWPENWYRRSTPWGAVETLAAGYGQIYPYNIVLPLASTLGTPNFNASTVLCEIYQGINSITPLLFAAEEADAAAAASWALNKLDAAFPANTFLGCPVNTLSPNTPGYSGLYANASQTGGPLAPPASQVQWVKNNVYNRTYFTTEPTAPACSH